RRRARRSDGACCFRADARLESDQRRARQNGTARGHESRGGRAFPGEEGARAPRRQRCARRESARTEPERLLPPAPEARSRTEMKFERRVLALALASGAFATVVALALLWRGDHGTNTRITLTVFLLLLWLSFAFSVRGRVVYTFQTLSNLLAAL